MRERLAVGVMSGTSADGATAALVAFRGPRARVLRLVTLPYPPWLSARVLAAPRLRAPELSRLSAELGELFARAALRAAGRARPEAVGSHGQTVWHGPGDAPPNTLQIGEAAVIAERTGWTVVADFRPRDLAAGGQGAPLVPAFDLFLYGDGPPRAAVNIGGIANASLVGNGRLQCAFDTGPGNALMDEAVRRATKGRRAFDAGGRLAASAAHDEPLVQRVLSHPYFFRPPPKSLDRSAFGPSLLSRLYPKLAPRGLPRALSTLAEITARSIWRGVLEAQTEPLAEVLVSGGGALNAHLMRRLASYFSPTPVRPTSARGMPVMAKEAACFAWLALRTLDGLPGNEPAATGARGPRVLGKIVRP